MADHNRAMPGGKGSEALREWGAEGSQRIATWLQRIKVRFGSRQLVKMTNGAVTLKVLDKLGQGTDPSPRFARIIADTLQRHGYPVDLDAVAKGRAT